MHKDPTSRLDRRTAGQWLHESKGLLVRLRSRDREVRVPRTILGKSRKVREFKIRRVSRVVDPSPNAPQLIRLVRHPFKLHAAHPRRTEGREQVPWRDLRRDVIPAVSTVVHEERVQLTWGNPLRGFQHGPAARPRASVQDWIAKRGW